ncbi:MAG: hypothetical protein FWG87_06955 [Defluviitaleaceae bacterium]|nr:hypothetical protein [Defluviitaleaceae bacterium]
MLGFIFAAVLVSVMALGFFICGVLMKAHEDKALQEMVQLDGTLVGYGRTRKLLDVDKFNKTRPPSAFVKKHRRLFFSPTDPVIEITVNGEAIRQRIRSIYLWPDIHPVGMKLKVLHRRERYLTKDSDYIRIDEDGLRPLSLYIIANIFKAIALALFAVAISLVVSGMKNN